MNWSDVVDLCKARPVIEEGTSYGTPALKVSKKLLIRVTRTGDSLILHDIPLDEKEMLTANDPAVFHTTPHYDGYPIVLLRLAAISPEDLKIFLKRRLSTSLVPRQ